jgi:hypothetical protein
MYSFVPPLDWEYLTHRRHFETITNITGFLDFFHRPVFLGVETRRFENWICFCPQVKGGEDTYSVGRLR